MSHEFDVHREVILPASPDEVWAAISTPEGAAAWQFPVPIEPSAAAIWEPGRHLAVRMEQGEWFNALEYEIEGRDGSTTVLRYAHSGIFLSDWETQYDAVQQHTDFYLHTLGEYLRHFQGRAVTYIGEVPGGILGPPESAAPDGFVRLRTALGLEDSAVEGADVALAPAGLDAIAGVLDYRQANFIGVRTGDSLYRFFGRNAFGAPVGMSIHAFGPVDGERVMARWSEWLASSLS